MEKGIITVRPTKKGFAGEVKLENGKTMSIPPKFAVNTKLNNKECELVREKGQIMDVVVDGKSLKMTGSVIQTPKEQRFRQVNQNRNNANPRGSNSTRPQQDPKARAPYNFVSLNDCVVKAPDIPTFDMYHEKDRFTGYIDLELETVTPMYIRGTSENAKETEKTPDFFSPGGQARIPGSSIRGMVRNLVEIASWSKFNFFDDKVLYYRRLADTSSVEKEYQNNMAPYDRQKKSSVYKFNAGYLAKDGFKYLIVPAKKENGKQFMQLKKKNSDEFVVEKRQDGKYLVISGKMEGKKHDWLINEPDLKAEKIPVPKEDIRAYENDDNRYVDKKNKDDFMKKDGNLLRLLNIGLEKLVPCFYVLWKDTSGRERVSFGHTGYFRLAYKKSVGDHIPEHISKANLIDMTDAIFGKEAEFAGRVFFEDAVLVPGHNNIYMDEVSPKILSGPKATTFQHYLEQKTSNVKTLSHWNSPDADIRGNKMYWHKNINDNELSWREEVVNPDTQHTVIRPVRPLLKFVGRIRFENLSEEELGALLFVLALPGNHYHKLGMGKPLGLGSVKITPKLIITSRLERYLKLFSGEGWALAEKPGVIDAFITQFEQYIMEHLRHSNSNDLGNAKTLWDTERLRQLKCMLDWQNTVIPGWSEKTRYMEIEHPNPQARNGTENEYKNRPVLPDPEKVVKT